MCQDTKKRLANSKGFTIVEVVLVLAIAGLIFMLVFTSYRWLREQQRLSGIKQDVALVGAAVNKCLANNANIPSGCDENDEVIVDPKEFAQSTGYGYAMQEYGNQAIFLVDGPVWLYNTTCSPGSISAYEPVNLLRFTVSVWLSAERQYFGNARPSYCQAY